ncbi:hypothetical protein CR513_30632, partial [Mucuna pruriens]
MGRPTLNKLRVVVSTLHLCMKYPVGQEVGRVWVDHRVARRCYENSLRIGSQLSQAGEPNVNVLNLNLDPMCEDERERPLLAEDLKEEDESHLVTFLRENRDVFAWSPADMPGVDPNFLCHHLSISPGYRPVTQRRRKLGEEKRKAAREETKKLLATGFIREIQYPTWLANVVMVKKDNGKWRMCTDYTNLNKACPKDPYSLPNIDRLVYRASDFALLSFIDAYSGYN